MTMRRDVHDELRARLHEAAGAHEPDPARILARIERGMTEQTRTDDRATRPPVFGWVRVVSATAAVACVLGVGGYAVASAVKEKAPARQTVAKSPPPAPAPDATTGAPIWPVEPTDGTDGTKGTAGTPGSPQETGRPSTSPPRSPRSTATAAPPASGTEDGPLWSDGSVDPHSNEFWAQSDITLKTTEKLTALTVELKVRQTGGVSSAGAWRSLPEGDFTATVTERDGFLVYTWVLRTGRTVWPGEWVFAGQYDHTRGGRDATNDGYSVTATASGEQLAVAGDFAAHGDGGEDDGEDAAGDS
ncbi:hypothetical protein M2271_003175 [Streptomyces sp. LBL]|uniref:hypothetical protein n=1 Tax=Streptomyces sp. LBL TaxID=2940562 RepID=UPI0024755D61|nr:hypothetical protein [Streptomyces sp. LBL]MDH6625364.1 hypothetical protein [Streptomyces sp. LBL]